MIGAVKLTIFCFQQRLTIKIIVLVWKAQQKKTKIGGNQSMKASKMENQRKWLFMSYFNNNTTCFFLIQNWILL